MSQDVKFSQDEQTRAADASYIKFPGTAGVRFVTIPQLRATGGVWLSLNGVRTIVKELKPKMTILTRFGMKMLKARPHEIAIRLSDELDHRILMA